MATSLAATGSRAPQWRMVVLVLDGLIMAGVVGLQTYGTHAALTPVGYAAIGGLIYFAGWLRTSPLDGGQDTATPAATPAAAPVVPVGPSVDTAALLDLGGQLLEVVTAAMAAKAAPAAPAAEVVAPAAEAAATDGTKPASAG